MHNFIRRLSVGLFLLGVAGSASAQTVAPPNVHFLLDTSGSMQELPQVANSKNSEFFAITVNGCENPRLDAFAAAKGWDPYFVYPVPDQGTGMGSDTGFPNLFQDSKFYGWMQWGSSSNPTPQWNTDTDACNAQIPLSNPSERARCLWCLGAKGYYLVPGTLGRDTPPLQNNNFIFWGRYLNFNPPKYVTARVALKQVLKEIQAKRVGLSRFSSSSPNTVMEKPQNPSCSQVLSDPSSFGGHRASYIDSVNGLTFNTGTPLGRSLLNIGYYFTSGDDVYRDMFGFGTSYSYPAGFKNAPLTSESRSVCWGCQHNAAIIISDGEPSGDSLTTTMAGHLRAVNGGPVYCPDSEPCVGSNGQPDKGFDPNDYADDHRDYLLDDVAMLLANQDLQVASPPVVGDFDTSGRQSLTVHTVAYGFNSNFLKHTAAVGGGLYFSADDAASLKQALQSILVDVETRAAACVFSP